MMARWFRVACLGESMIAGVRNAHLYPERAGTTAQRLLLPRPAASTSIMITLKIILITFKVLIN